MELTMAAQADATPWTLPAIHSPLDSGVNSSSYQSADQSSGLMESESIATKSLLHGRGYFSILGVVRRKPSRPDAPPTLSKSCSDKIASREVISLLSSITSLLIYPSNAYISSLILPETQCSSVGCTRAFSSSGRMKEHAGATWEGGYSFRPFEIRQTDREFISSRRQGIDTGGKLVPSNISASWTPYGFEALIGGVLQGRKQGDIRGASRVCKRSMWQQALKIAELINASYQEKCLRKTIYTDVKADDLLTQRRAVKDIIRESSLRGWVRNIGDEHFAIENEQ